MVKARIFYLVLLTALFSGLVSGAAACGPESGAPPAVEPSGEGSGEGSGERVAVGDTEARVWGEGGEQGVVLSHGAVYDAESWEAQGRALAESGLVALAVEDTSGESVGAAMDYLRDVRGTENVALIGASAGSSAVLEAAREKEGEVSALILLSGTGDTSDLGAYPKLFVASEGEGLEDSLQDMAAEAPGDRNEVLILPGNAHAQAIFTTEEGDRLLQAILERVR